MTGPAVLVTGASGFIGRALVRRLLGAGRPVEAPDLGLDPTALDPGFTAAYALAGNVLYEVPGFLGGDVKEAAAMFRKGRRLLDALGERS